MTTEQTLHIFAGQGVRHMTEGYGMISRVPVDREKAKNVYVKFTNGERFVSVAALLRAEMPYEEAERIRAKYEGVKK